ncbi:MAG: hypothetical protein ABSA75_13760 [Candidatus Bathyarchaeia archaeon]|jgi:hypothetical protein
MVTIIPGYMYSIFAALIVGTIIVSSCTLSMVNIKNEAERQQLANIDENVAAQSLTLVTHVTEDGQNTTQFLDLPSQIGNKAYWICIVNDSSSAWVESGFGTNVIQSQPQIYIPAEISASGAFISGWGRAFLLCYYENQTIVLTLNSE